MSVSDATPPTHQHNNGKQLTKLLNLLNADINVLASIVIEEKTGLCLATTFFYKILSKKLLIKS